MINTSHSFSTLEVLQEVPIPSQMTVFGLKVARSCQKIKKFKDGCQPIHFGEAGQCSSTDPSGCCRCRPCCRRAWGQCSAELSIVPCMYIQTDAITNSFFLIPLLLKFDSIDVSAFSSLAISCSRSRYAGYLWNIKLKFAGKAQWARPSVLRLYL